MTADPRTTAVNPNLERLISAGLTIWMDGADAGLPAAVADGSVTGAVQQPAQLRAEVAAGRHDQVLRDEPGEGLPAALVVAGARSTADLLLPLHHDSGGTAGWVAIDLPPAGGTSGSTAGATIADGLPGPDPETAVAAAVRLWERVDRPNVQLKIPVTGTGPAVIARLLAAGIPVHATAVVDGAGHRAALDALRSGLEGSPDPAGSTASVFVVLSEVDSEADRRLWKIGTDSSGALRGKLAVASAQLLHEAHVRALADERWAALEREGAVLPQLVWTSTVARDPYYSETLYVDGLVGPGLVSALTPGTLELVKEQTGFDGDPIGTHYQQARRTVDAFVEVGVDLAEVAGAVQVKVRRDLETAWRSVLQAIASRSVTAG